MAKTRAFSYLRVSGLGQVSGDGFPRQREVVGKYAKAHNIEIAQEYRDEGVCGERELADRNKLDNRKSNLRHVTTRENNLDSVPRRQMTILAERCCWKQYIQDESWTPCDPVLRRVVMARRQGNLHKLMQAGAQALEDAMS